MLMQALLKAGRLESRCRGVRIVSEDKRSGKWKNFRLLSSQSNLSKFQLKALASPQGNNLLSWHARSIRVMKYLHCTL